MQCLPARCGATGACVLIRPHALLRGLPRKEMRSLYENLKLEEWGAEGCHTHQADMLIFDE